MGKQARICLDRNCCGTLSEQKIKEEFSPSCWQVDWNIGVLYEIRLSDNFLTSGGLILAADYSQLELRILAHLSCDCRLIQALNGGTDVFKSIAAEWKMIDPKAIGDRTRQQAKQVILGKKISSSFLGRKGQYSTHCSMFFCLSSAMVVQ